MPFVRSYVASRALAALALLLSAALPALAQDSTTPAPANGGALRVFLDCDRGCDFNFIRQEIDFVNWVRDRRDSQVHVLVTRQGTGGGVEFRLEFIGVDEFVDQDQVLLFASSSTDTDDERRRGFARIVRLGLARYLAQTPLAAYADLVVRRPSGDDAVNATASATPENDPWNFWVFSIGVEGFFRGESRSNRQSNELSLRASRTTQAWKIRFDTEIEYDESEFEFDDGSTFRNVARSFDAGGQVVKSLGDQWGAGVGASVRQSTFFNLAPSYRAAAALEYNLFPYDLSSQKQLTFTYFLGASRFNYDDETIFFETSETLIDQGFIVSLDLERPWGSANLELDAVHFVQHPSEFNLELNGSIEYRIIRGLSLDLFGGIESIRSQRFLPLGGASDEDVLLERRALNTDFRFFAGFGIRYTFGSIFNNVVNARLSRSRRGFHTIF